MAKAARRTLVRKLPRVRRTGFLLTLCVAIVALAVQLVGASAATPPPTLTGETLLGGLFTPEASSVVVTSASCDPGGTSTFTYQASGPASLPYAGTYSETGTVTIGPQTTAGTPPSGQVTSWTASFTINSAIGTVAGTKSLPPNTPDIAGICTGTDVSPAQESAATGAQSVLLYTATITVPGGSQFMDKGGSQASVNVFPDIPAFNNFFENFTSSQTTTTPVCNQDSQNNQNQSNNNQGCANP
jgi:hypothetical protein